MDERLFDVLHQVPDAVVQVGETYRCPCGNPLVLGPVRPQPSVSSWFSICSTCGSVAEILTSEVA